MNERIQNEQLQMGRRALQESGKSPRQVGLERTRSALRWIYNWGWSTPSTIELLVGANKAGLATRLQRGDLINRTRTESGGAQREVPAYILTLTESGIQEVERFLEEESSLLPYDVDPYRVNQAVLRHDNMAQVATAKALRAGTINSYLTERQMAVRSEKGMKQPDVLWFREIENRQLRMAIEVELSAKWSRDLDQFIHRCITALSGDQARFHQIVLITDSPAIKNRYEKAMKAGSEYNIWVRDAQRRWSITDTAKVPQIAEDRFLCRLIKRS